MARFLKPLVRSGGYYPSRRWTPLVYPGGYTTANGGEEPAPPPVEKTVIGNPIHILDALAKPAQALSVKLEPIQAGSGDPSPTNIRPISGWTGAKVTRTGVNLAESVHTESATNVYTSALFVEAELRPSTTYTLSFIGTAGNKLYINERIFNYVSVDVTGAKQTVTVTTISAISKSNSQQYTDGKGWLIFKNNQNQPNPNVFTDVQLELGSTATAYEPYQGQTYSIAFPSSAGTVYGGTLDVTGGKMVVDRAMVDIGTLDYTAITLNGSPGFYTSALNSVILAPANNNETPLLCSCYKNISANALWLATSDTSIICVNMQKAVQIRDTRYSTAADLKAALNGQTLAYPLASPFEITLTPTQIEMLLGENNLWADAGDSTLTYYADGNASDAEALGILLGGRYTPSDDVTDKEALDIILGGMK